MSYEVDILAVGDKSDSGDAITFRFGNFIQSPEDQHVIVIDGGFQDSGKKLVERIRNEYETEDVDLVISTHPDSDHISGLHVVLEELRVGQLWMHRPWYMSGSIKKLAEEGRELTTLGLSNKLKKSLESAYDLEKLAEKRGVPVVDPFQGINAFDNRLHILGPSQELYQQLAADFEKGSIFSLIGRGKRIISEVWHQDKLTEPGAEEVNPRNNSSVILLALLGNDHFLFTGDAGVVALHHAADYAVANGYDLLPNVTHYQVPHHGSKRNLGPSILDRIVGPIQQQQIQETRKTAFISAAAEGNPKHPSKRVSNALIRRGATVTATCGVNHCFRSPDIPMRPGWESVTPLGFSHTFEEED